MRRHYRNTAIAATVLALGSLWLAQCGELAVARRNLERERKLRNGAYFMELADKGKGALKCNEASGNAENYNRLHPDVSVVVSCSGSILEGFYVVPRKSGAGYSGMDKDIVALAYRKALK